MREPSQGQAGAVSAFNIRQNWNHLIRRPTFQEPVIDGVRAIAILWVILLHMVFFQFDIFPAQALKLFTQPATAWIFNGNQGVDLFFVISGFLMGSILFTEIKKSGSIIFSRFYVRRFLRLIPVYMAAMVLAVYLQHNLPGYPKWGNAEYFWANLLYVNNFVPVMKQYMLWCWSLAIEEQFYLVLPAFLLLFMRLRHGRVRTLVGLMGLSVAIRFTVIHVTGFVPPFRYTPNTPPWAAWFDTIYDKPWMRLGGCWRGYRALIGTAIFLSSVSGFSRERESSPPSLRFASLPSRASHRREWDRRFLNASHTWRGSFGGRSIVTSSR
jgi:peptidoglycan/LPS O-acetylase OafA/YrhL